MEAVPIKGFERYTITTNGIIYDTHNHRPVPLHPYTVNGKTYVRINLQKPQGGQKRFQHHRLMAVMFVENPDNKPFVDHKNGDSIDNKPSNLRWVTHKENMRNATKKATTSCSFKGVSKYRDHSHEKKPFKASIRIDGKPYHLGFYSTELEAAIAYDTAALEAGFEHHNGLIRPHSYRLAQSR